MFLESSVELTEGAGPECLPFGMVDNFPKVSFKARRRASFLASASSNLVVKPLSCSSFSVNRKPTNKKDRTSLYFDGGIWIILT